MGTFSLQSGLGSLGEKLGCQYLKRKGYVILVTNYCNASGRRIGEIDIVAKKDSAIVFVEVKTRLKSDDDTMFPEANITPMKLRKLERIATHYLRENYLGSASYHFDALAIVYDHIEKKASIRHLEYIFF